MEPITVDGKSGTVVYFDREWNIVARAQDAERAKIVFDDGSRGFYVLQSVDTAKGFVLDDRELILDYRELVRKYSDDQPRDDRGRWTDGGSEEFDPDQPSDDLGRSAIPLPVATRVSDILSPNVHADTRESVDSVLRLVDVEKLDPILPSAATDVVSGYSPDEQDELRKLVMFGAFDDHAQGTAVTLSSKNYDRAIVAVATKKFSDVLGNEVEKNPTATVGSKQILAYLASNPSDRDGATRMVARASFEHELGHVMNWAHHQKPAEELAQAFHDLAVSRGFGSGSVADQEKRTELIKSTLSDYAWSGGAKEAWAEAYQARRSGYPLPKEISNVVDRYTTFKRPARTKQHAASTWPDDVRAWADRQPPDLIELDEPKSAKYSDDQPRVPAGEPDGGQWTDGGAGSGEDTSEAAVTERELSKQANEGIEKIDALVGKALAVADFRGSGEGDPDSEDDDYQASWSDFDAEEQDEVHDKWQSEQYESDDYLEAGSAAEREAAKDSIRDDQDEIAESASDKLMEVLVRDPRAIDAMSEDAPLLGEKLTLTLDKDTIVFEELSVHDDPFETQPNLDRDALRTVSGKELTDAQKDLIENAWADSWNEAREEYVDNGRDNGKWQDAESMAIDEAINDAWNNMSDNAKYEFAVNNGFIPENAAGPSIGDFTPGLPTAWKWESDHEGDDEDYIRTRIIANTLTRLRTDELLHERGVDAGIWYDNPITGQQALSPSIYADSITENVWDEWKRSSSYDLSHAMQLAVARELGGVHRLTDEEVKRAIAKAGSVFGGASSYQSDELREKFNELGMKRLQAYVRAQWETSQYVLSKSGTDRVETYRALLFKPQDLAGLRKEEIAVHSPSMGRNLVKLPDISIQRGGLQSTTMNRGVANSWAGVAWRGPGERVVLRISAPRTSVFSLPVFGKNVKSEREVVLAGTKGKWKWDAWHFEAPKYSDYALKMRRGKSAKFVIDLTDIDRGQPHWLTGANKKKAVKFDPDQPRDEHGRWTGGGGASGWTRAEGEAFVQATPFNESGYRAEIVGSVNTRGESEHDLDILLTPTRADYDFERLWSYLAEQGAELQETHKEGETLVEARLADGRIVDFFFGESEYD